MTGSSKRRYDIGLPASRIYTPAAYSHAMRHMKEGQGINVGGHFCSRGGHGSHRHYRPKKLYRNISSRISVAGQVGDDYQIKVNPETPFWAEEMIKDLRIIGAKENCEVLAANVPLALSVDARSPSLSLHRIDRVSVDANTSDDADIRKEIARVAIASLATGFITPDEVVGIYEPITGAEEAKSVIARVTDKYKDISEFMAHVKKLSPVEVANARWGSRISDMVEAALSSSETVGETHETVPETVEISAVGEEMRPGASDEVSQSGPPAAIPINGTSKVTTATAVASKMPASTTEEEVRVEAPRPPPPLIPLSVSLPKKPPVNENAAAPPSTSPPVPIPVPLHAVLGKEEVSGSFDSATEQPSVMGMPPSIPLSGDDSEPADEHGTPTPPLPPSLSIEAPPPPSHLYGIIPERVSESVLSSVRKMAELADLHAIHTGQETKYITLIVPSQENSKFTEALEQEFVNRNHKFVEDALIYSDEPIETGSKYSSDSGSCTVRFPYVGESTCRLHIASNHENGPARSYRADIVARQESPGDGNMTIVYLSEPISSGQ